MIVLDTNVLSEALRPKPSAKVLDWLRSQPITALFTTTITEAELYYGFALLPKSKRGVRWNQSWNQFSLRTWPVACYPSTARLRESTRT